MPPPGQVGPGDRLGRPLQVRDRAAEHHLATLAAGLRADVDHPVGGPDRVLVVLDHDQRVAQVAQPGQGADQLLVVPLVQPDRRLVQHVQHAGQPGADLGRQPDPLRFPAGQGRGRPVQRQVTQADVGQEPEPGSRLLPDPGTDLLVARAQGQFGQPPRGLAHRQRGHVRDRPARDGDGQDLRPQPGPAARRARHRPHVALELLPGRVRLGFGVPALDPGQHALEPHPVRAVPPGPGPVTDPDLLTGAVQHGVPGRLGQLVPRRVQAEPAGLRGRRQQPGEVLPLLPARPRRDRTLAQRLAAVRHGQRRVGLHLGAQAAAHRAGALRRVERERPRLQLIVQAHRVTVGAGQVLGEPPFPLGVVGGPVHQFGQDHTVGQLERGLDRVGDSRPARIPDHQSVDYHFY